MTIKIGSWSHSNHHNQRAIGGSQNEKVWTVPHLIHTSRDLPVMNIPLEHLSIDVKIAGNIIIREFVSHMRAVIESNLDYPIILDENGTIFDGRHRVAKALLEEQETIKAVRFEHDPEPVIVK